MKMKVIFIPYCNFATSGLSELHDGEHLWDVGEKRIGVHEGKHLPADCEWKGDDEEHEERHLCHEEQEDLSEQSVMCG
jgi:hypothetical protein